MLAIRTVPAVLVAVALAGPLLVVSAVASAAQDDPRDWPIHSLDRPRPPAIDPGPAGPPAPAPSDATVLFDGTDLSAWRSRDGGPAPWRVDDGYFEVVPGAGTLVTAQSFGDVQIHIEWSTPAPAEGEGQNRGNSGVFFLGRYEVQVLDSYGNDTYPDGQAGAVYGQYPPLVNASRPPGEWQSYDIVFRAPRFDDTGELVEPARMTVFHNGVLVHDDVELIGPTSHRRRAPYEAHPPRLPISLQDHGHPVRFRNVWVRIIGGVEKGTGLVWRGRTSYGKSSCYGDGGPKDEYLAYAPPGPIRGLSLLGG